MTKKHFEAIARVVFINCEDDKERERWAKHLCWCFGQINPRFNDHKFIDACKGKIK